jgi:hypothetical protein
VQRRRADPVPVAHQPGAVSPRESTKREIVEEHEPDSDADDKPPYASEFYSVRRHYFRDICDAFLVRPEIDAFADDENCLCSEYWTAEDDALKQSWQGRNLWVHPPWQLWDQVVEKIKNSEDCTIVAIVPGWKADFVTELMNMSSKRKYYEPGTRFYELHRRPTQPVRWGTWALLIHRVIKDPKVRTPAAESHEQRVSNSAKRRKRRKTLRNVRSEERDAQENE